MARKGREKSKIGIYHVLLRGVDMLFDNDEDYTELYKTLERYISKNGLRILAYVFLKNRVHLVVDTVGEDIGIVLKPVCTSYARYFNRVHQAGGRLFYDRFKSEPIDTGEEAASAIAFVNFIAERQKAEYCSLNEQYSGVCSYKKSGITDEEFKSTVPRHMFIEDYDSLERTDLEDMLYIISEPAGDFAVLDAEDKERAVKALTKRRTISKTKVYDIMGMSKPAPKPAKKKSEEKKDNGLSIWLL